MSFFGRLLGKSCTHYFSWPRTDADGRYYQICSHCGVAYEYDWASMRLTDRRMTASTVTAPMPAAIPRDQGPAGLPPVR